MSKNLEITGKELAVLSWELVVLWRVWDTQNRWFYDSAVLKYSKPVGFLFLFVFFPPQKTQIFLINFWNTWNWWLFDSNLGVVCGGRSWTGSSLKNKKTAQHCLELRTLMSRGYLSFWGYTFYLRWTDPSMKGHLSKEDLKDMVIQDPLVGLPHLV
jgi:hypothetical protein